jgi:hypothetical protein
MLNFFFPTIWIISLSFYCQVSHLSNLLFFSFNLLSVCSERDWHERMLEQISASGSIGMISFSP